MPAREALKEIEARRSTAMRMHEASVGQIAALVAAAMGQERGACEALAVAAELHDIGKLAIAESLLNKPGKLDPTEWQAVQLHTTHGYQILRAAGGPLAELAASVALNHHECWDGTGYPNQLKGNQIPLMARIASVSDYYDALREIRAYKAPRTHEEVLHMILHGDGRVSAKFDPAILSFLSSDPDLLRRAHDAHPPVM